MNGQPYGQHYSRGKASGLIQPPCGNSFFRVRGEGEPSNQKAMRLGGPPSAAEGDASDAMGADGVWEDPLTVSVRCSREPVLSSALPYPRLQQ